MNRRIDGWTLAMALPLLVQTTLAGAVTCEEILPKVQQFYDNTADSCTDENGKEQAAYNCGGLIARGTERPERRGGKAGDSYTWQAGTRTLAQGTQSATYLRKDIIYRDVTVFKDQWTNFNNGFVIRPPSEVLPGQTTTYLACGAPVDQWANERNSQGCGDNQKTPYGETSCKAQGVTGQAWPNAYAVPNLYNSVEMIGGNTCIFDFRTMDNLESTDAFKQFLIARRAFQDIPDQDTAFGSYTEVRFNVTPENKPPVWFFFHSDAEGREDAEKNAMEYKEQTGIDVPVIEIHYPKDKNSTATFSCKASPQPGPAPVPEPDTTASDRSAGGWGSGDDPKKCSRYFDSVFWITRWDPGFNQFIEAVSVTPSACGREIGSDQTDAAFAELKQKAMAEPGGVTKWNNKDATLRRQYVCHMVLDVNGLPVRYKQEYNLEPIRPEVSHEQSLVDRCNPVGPQNADPGTGANAGGWGPNGSKQCSQYVSSVKWVPRKFAEYGDRTIMSLEVIPTDCGRQIGSDQTDKMMAEIKKKALEADKRGGEYWGDKDRSMRLQTSCLLKNHRDKPEWNIESIRPNELSFQQYEAADCNPK